MKLKPSIDAQIRSELDKIKLTYSTKPDGTLDIYEYRMDLYAGMGMLYLAPEVLGGAGKEVVIKADYVWVVGYENGVAMNIEIGTNALTGELVDYYVEKKKKEQNVESGEN